jgi:hypothetical protein
LPDWADVRREQEMLPAEEHPMFPAAKFFNDCAVVFRAHPLPRRGEG